MVWNELPRLSVGPREVRWLLVDLDLVRLVLRERGRALIRIGFFLLSMINLSLFPLFKKHLSHNPEVQEKMVKGLLIPLAIADVGLSSFSVGL